MFTNVKYYALFIGVMACRAPSESPQSQAQSQTTQHAQTQNQRTNKVDPMNAKPKGPIDEKHETPCTVEELYGRAVNGKAGAMLLLPNGDSLYVLGQDAWPTNQVDKDITLRGVVSSRKHIPDPVNERGEIVQGAFGTQRVLQRVAEGTPCASQRK